MPADHGAEDDRADHHLDELDEGVAKRLHLDGECRREVAEQHADQDRGQHVHVELAIKGDALTRRCFRR